MTREAGTWVGNAAWLALGELCGKGGLFLATVVVGRLMGPGALGQLTVGLTVALIAVQLLAMGQAELLVREAALRPGRAVDLVRDASALQRRVALPVLLALAAGAFVLPGGPLRLAVWAFLPYALVRTAMATRLAVFRGLDRTSVEFAARLAETTVLLPTLWLLGTGGLPAWSLGAGFLLAAIAGLVVVQRRLSELEVEADGGGPPGIGHFGEGLAFLGGGLLLQLLLRQDTLLLGAFEVSEEQIGYFGAAATLTWGLLGGAQLLAIAVYPTLSRRGVRSPRSILPWVLGLGVLPGSVAALVLFLFRAPLLELFYSATFLPAGDLLAVLGAALPSASGAMLLGVVLAAQGRQSQTALAYLAAVGASLAANLYYVPLEGAPGAARVAPFVHAGLMVVLFVLSVTGGASRREGEAS